MDLVAADRALVASQLERKPDIDSVAGFVPGPGIERLALRFDIDELRAALGEIVERVPFGGDHGDAGFGAISMTRRPGQTTETATDLSGRYWLRPDERYVEESREEIVDESAYSELVPAFADTYFEFVYASLRERFPLGRMRLLSKGLYNCNSWHRDPEPRIHVPITSNPGSLFVAGNHCTHLPADGSTYFTDTRLYHTAMNGGPSERVHLVAALPLAAEGRSDGT